MKNFLTICLSCLVAAGLCAQQRQIFIPGYDKEPDDEPIELFSPYEPVHSGRELPRTFTVSYPDDQAAAEGAPGPSLYIQPMEAAPQVVDGGAYREYTWTYKMPFAWVGRLIFLYIESADNPYSVYINGSEAGNNQSSRSAAEFDVTALSKEGLNRLSIRVEKDPAASVLTAARGSGTITGQVLVHSQPRIRVRDFVAEANFQGEEPTLQLGIILKTHMLNARMVRLHYWLRDMEGHTVASGHREAEVGLKEEDTVRFFTPVSALLPWTYESPQLYDLVIRNQYEGRNTEFVRYRVGFSNTAMKEGRLYTDQFPVPLAFHRVGDNPGGQPLEGILSGIKEEGYNVVIAGDRPQPRRFYDLCDSLGLYVCVQADINSSAAGDSPAVGGNPSNDPRWAASFVDRALTMYGTTANRPSSLMFSIARNSSQGYCLQESYLALKERESRRPVIYPEGNGQWNSDAVTPDFSRSHPDAVGERIVLDPQSVPRVYPDLPYSVIAVGPDGKCRVTNNSFVTPLKGTISYSIRRGMKKVAEGSVPVAVAPGSETTVDIPVPESEAGKKLKFEATLSSNLN